LRAQVLVIPCTAFQELPGDSKTAHVKASGLLNGLLVNCTDETYLMALLELSAEMGHEVEVSILKDDEPWPTIEFRREAWQRQDQA
jgi:hypothetical protein